MWIEQLIAESTGKEGTGILPVEGEPLGRAPSYGADRFFASIDRDRRRDDGSGDGPLARAGHPAAHFEM